MGILSEEIKNGIISKGELLNQIAFALHSEGKYTDEALKEWNSISPALKQENLTAAEVLLTHFEQCENDGMSISRYLLPISKIIHDKWVARQVAGELGIDASEIFLLGAFSNDDVKYIKGETAKPKKPSELLEYILNNFSTKDRLNKISGIEKCVSYPQLPLKEQNKVTDQIKYALHAVNQATNDQIDYYYDQEKLVTDMIRLNRETLSEKIKNGSISKEKLLNRIAFALHSEGKFTDEALNEWNSISPALKQENLSAAEVVLHHLMNRCERGSLPISTYLPVISASIHDHWVARQLAGKLGLDQKDVFVLGTLTVDDVKYIKGKAAKPKNPSMLLKNLLNVTTKEKLNETRGIENLVSYDELPFEKQIKDTNQIKYALQAINKATNNQNNYFANQEVQVSKKINEIKAQNNKNQVQDY